MKLKRHLKNFHCDFLCALLHFCDKRSYGFKIYPHKSLNPLIYCYIPLDSGNAGGTNTDEEAGGLVFKGQTMTQIWAETKLNKPGPFVWYVVFQISV
jgi:hypothetical protein